MTEKENIKMTKYMDKIYNAIPEDIDASDVFDKAVSKLLKKELRKSLKEDTGRKLSGKLIVKGSKRGCNRQLIFNTNEGNSFKFEFCATHKDAKDGVYDVWKNNDKTLLQTFFDIEIGVYSKRREFNDLYNTIRDYLESQEIGLEESDKNMYCDIDF